ncbi:MULTISPECIES: hypothetical protein [unclassified Ensifer]|uniref:hypothetical protein n=1 Tax=unclassified Ensifer TaxID=2633371 RepID=UPI000812C754|nr:MULTISPECIES: hypothetical protein [unclassified Ensifer]OCP01837.1 hypothetical protein BC362_21780 [Ensifer sp. LC14]OCP04575.1 hypothetical protein BBX50_25125 [Ensifer sp. LC11]OCP09626.1 hypothetical protein BC374_03520 [Ensifer sp. LC13]OCP30673.1 hypothetical protein BC364_24810 [Ensifer sp. LC499]
MRHLTCAIASLLALLSLSACSQSSSSSPPRPSTSEATAAALRGGNPTDERACEQAVAKQTNSADIATLSSDMSQANTQVIIGVGPERSRWRCLVSGGKVAEVSSLADEGAM